MEIISSDLKSQQILCGDFQYKFAHFSCHFSRVANEEIALLQRELAITQSRPKMSFGQRLARLYPKFIRGQMNSFMSSEFDSKMGAGIAS